MQIAAFILTRDAAQVRSTGQKLLEFLVALPAQRKIERMISILFQVNLYRLAIGDGEPESLTKRANGSGRRLITGACVRFQI